MPRESVAAPDPVAEIGRQLTEVADRVRRREAERLQEANYAAQQALDAELRALEDLRESLEMSVSNLRATTPAGAMVHLVMAYEDVESMTALADDGQEYRSKQRRRSAYRNLYSALDVLAGLSAVKPADIGAEEYMPARFDGRVA